MFNRQLIAHELGHAICASALDPYWIPIDISFIDTDNSIANCNCQKLSAKKQNFKLSHNNTKSLVDLGGLFGELLYTGKWHPWLAGRDLEGYISSNYYSQKEIVVELDCWMYVDNDPLSYRACSSKFEYRNEFNLDSHDTARRLPELWSTYLEFCDRINKDKFNNMVDTIYKNKIKEITKASLKKMIKEIVNG